MQQARASSRRIICRPNPGTRLVEFGYAEYAERVMKEGGEQTGCVFDPRDVGDQGYAAEFGPATDAELEVGPCRRRVEVVVARAKQIKDSHPSVTTDPGIGLRDQNVSLVARTDMTRARDGKHLVGIALQHLDHRFLALRATASGRRSSAL